VTASGQLRTDLAADVAALRDTLTPAPLPAIDESRLAGIENVIASLRDELAIDRLEASVRDMAQDTSGLRADVRRSFDRVLHEISTTEQSLKGEVRAIDSRLTGFGEDLRLVRGLRDGLEALGAGVDAVRQLASRSATSTQMGELAHDLSTVLAEIETARSQVLAVDQQVGRIQAGAIDVNPPAGDVAKDVEDLERKVTDDIADLGARIEAIAERTVAAAEPDDPIAARLRSLATSARQLSMGIAEDLKARRGTKAKTRARAKKR
jgi:archaellum component FlaC